jgi:very-short-patch-repair endonuclease
VDIDKKRKRIGYAQKMRKRPTKAEEHLWNYLKNKQLGCRFIRQHLVLGFIADFACPSMGIVIEVDGNSHDGKEDKDKKRDEVIYRNGYMKTLRFTNEEVLHNTEQVVETISNWLKSSQNNRR